MKTFFVISLLGVMFFSCDGKKYSGSQGLSVTGKVGEILVVCDQGIWDSEIKTALDSNLTQFIMPYFPDVATFDLVHKTPSHFEQGVKRFRNTLMLTIDPKANLKEAEITKRENVFAHGQLIIEILAKDYNQLLEACKHKTRLVHNEFDVYEWKRIEKAFKEKKNPRVDEAIKSNFGISIALPDEARLVSKRANFFRIELPVASRPIEFVGGGGQDIGAILSGVMIYQYPYLDSSQFVLEKLLQDRDTMLKYNVPHEIEGMYMGTQYHEFVYPEGNKLISSDQSVQGYEVRGMFAFKGKFKNGTGGAFWSFHFKHPKRNQLITVSGYVDAPSTTSWTHAIREIQAIINSVSIAK